MVSVSSTRTAPRKTLWEEGRHSGRLVRTVTATILLAVALVDTVAFGRLTVLFDITFVVVCVAAALAVRPRDFFVVGCPAAALDARDRGDPGGVRALGRGRAGRRRRPGRPSPGLAHHAGALVVGYTLTLGILALRQVAARNAGVIRSGAHPTRVPRQRVPAESAEHAR